MNLKGYVSVRVPVPVSVQNMVVRDYCRRNNHAYSLSDVEFVFGGTAMLEGIDLAHFDGIVAYSMFQIPQHLVYQKEFHFALEGYVLPRDAEMCETIWRIKEAM